MNPPLAGGVYEFAARLFGTREMRDNMRQSETTTRSLGSLDISKFFCKCQMTSGGTEHICTTPEPPDHSERRRFYLTASALILGLLVIAWVIVLAFGN